MRVLTLHQPWASLVALGVKTIETRSWSTQYRGPLAIHAAARRMPLYGENGLHLWYLAGQHCDNNLGNDGYWGPVRYQWGTFPLGAIVATCTLVDVVPIVDREAENDAGVEPRSREVWVSEDDPVVLAEWDHGWTETEYLGDQLPYGDFSPGRYAWLLADVVSVDPPVPFKGGQRLSRTWDPMDPDPAKA